MTIERKRFFRAIVRRQSAVVSIKPSDTRALIETIDKYKLDFDDAYQYVAAEQNGLTLVSFDGDFDRTDKGKTTPAEVTT